METLKHAVKDFWDGTEIIKATKKGDMDKTIEYHLIKNDEIDVDAVHKCIERATIDITTRTLKPIHNEKSGVLAKMADDIAINGNLQKHIIEWLNSDADNYDDWHKTACEDVLNIVNEYYKNKDNTCVDYGKAQKVVNMTMKTLYWLVCNDDNTFAKYNDRFAQCHIPLDSYTLQWYKDYRNNTTAWSNLKKEEYYDISDNINNIFKNKEIEDFYGKYTPLQAEFFIWEKEQMKELIERLKKDLNRYQKNINIIGMLKIDTNEIDNLCKIHN